MINASHVQALEGRARPLYLSAAALLTLAIFAIDLSIPPSTGIAALYVVPLLIASYAGSPRLHIYATWLVSLLIVAAILRVPVVELPAVVILNRLVALAVVWTSVSIVVRLRQTTTRLEARTRDLTDTKYALDQSAIVATTNTRGTITFANDKFCEISKYSREELLGQDHRILNSGYHPKEFIRNLWQTIANGHIWRGEIRNRAKDGSIYWVDTTIVPFLDERGKPYQYIAIRYEITERKRSEEKLREQAALARLGEMAAVVAHEVKNPIAGIRGALQVIVSRMPADQRDRSIIGDIISRLDALNGIVQDLLLYSRPRQVKREPVDVRSLIDNTAELLRRDPALSGTRLQIDGSPDPVSADPEQLRIALQNLLMNAAQAMGGQGAIDVTLAADAESCRIGIRDHGPPGR
ncbi:MAG: PAS domain-containing protein [Acidobacteria bacterium]|nr:PAS domain-containing protein [Acidobacteriota bacterium]